MFETFAVPVKQFDANPDSAFTPEEVVAVSCLKELFGDLEDAAVDLHAKVEFSLEEITAVRRELCGDDDDEAPSAVPEEIKP